MHEKHLPTGVTMDFSGPEPADFDNVRALNRAFLLRLRDTSSGRPLRGPFASTVRAMLRNLSDLQVGRLAATPFLLLSLRERDDDYWRVLITAEANEDLFAASSADATSRQLTAASLAFLWQLSRRNPYATRLVSGATLNWCEQLADCTFLRLLQCTTARSDLLQPRLAANDAFWVKLLGPGLSVEEDVRRAAHLAALQSILTEDPAQHYRPIRAAACNTLLPPVRVTERDSRT